MSHFIKTLKPKGKSTREILHQYLSGYEDARDVSVLHASELTRQAPEFCARRKALHVALKKDLPDEFLSTSLKVTFGIGRYVEEQVAEWFADMGRAVGHWKCKYCGVTAKYQKRPKMCAECKGSLFKYIEWRAESTITGVSCGIDLLLDKGEDKLVLMEIKSLDKDEFKKLVMPQAEHRLRTRLYLRSTAESADPFASRINTEQGEVLYVSKGGFGVACPEVSGWHFKDAAFSPFKPFVVDRKDDEVQPYVDKALAWKAFKEQKKLPPRICNTTFEERAKGCGMLVPCFGGNY